MQHYIVICQKKWYAHMFIALNLEHIDSLHIWGTDYLKLFIIAYL